MDFLEGAASGEVERRSGLPPWCSETIRLVMVVHFALLYESISLASPNFVLIC